jgi:hypothetical protein
MISMDKRSQFSAEYIGRLRKDLARYAELDVPNVPVASTPDFESRELEVLGERLSSALARTRITAREMLTEHRRNFEQSPVFCDVTLLGPLGQSRRELSVTQVLAWLLDPNGGHGFGDSVLRALLSHAADESQASEEILAASAQEIAVFTEFAMNSRRRADIVVVARRSALVIEAKIDAKEQSDQTVDYAEYFSEAFERATFLFLAPPGVDPKSEQFMPLRYLELSRVLIAAISKSTSAAGFHYARYFIAGILRDMCGITTSNSLEKVMSGDCVKLEMLLKEGAA